MNKSISIAPPNSMFFLADPDDFECPEIDRSPVSAWTSASCVVIGCVNFIEGETRLTVTDDASLSWPDLAQVVDRVIATPRKLFAVSTSETDVLLQVAVPAARVRVRVWTNHPTQPDVIAILLGSGRE
jgi:hypothetical protein